MNGILRLFINYSLFIIQISSFIVKNVIKHLKNSKSHYSNSIGNTL